MHAKLPIGSKVCIPLKNFLFHLGQKIQVTNVPIRRGILLLDDQNCTLLQQSNTTAVLEARQDGASFSRQDGNAHLGQTANTPARPSENHATENVPIEIDAIRNVENTQYENANIRNANTTNAPRERPGQHSMGNLDRINSTVHRESVYVKMDDVNVQI